MEFKFDCTCFLKATARILVLATLVASVSALAATPLIDFESAAAVDELPYRIRGKNALDIVPVFSTSGTNSLRFTSPLWRKGLPEWPSFELKPTLRDWRGYDRLVVDIINPSPENFFFALYVSDARVPFREGLHHKFTLASCGASRSVIQLSDFPDKVNRAEIATLHFFGERPHSDMALHFGSIMLLKKGEEIPEPPARFIKEMATLSKDALDAADRTIALLGQTVEPYCETPEIRANARRHLERLSATFQTLRQELTSELPTLDKLAVLQSELAKIPARAARLSAMLKYQQSCVQAGIALSPMLVGTASSMEQLLPRDAPFTLQPLRTVQVRLARNEKESFQLAVLPADGGLEQVSVSVSDLVAAGGATLARSRIDCDVTGYVETKTRPPYSVTHVGWWPDPILNFLGPIDIAPCDLQSFWVRIRAPRDQASGEYRGTLTVTAANAPAVKLELRVRIYGFTLPDESPLPLAVTFAPHDSPTAATKELHADWHSSPDYPVNAWKKHAVAWGDFLADYYLTYDSLYHSGMPDFEILQRLKAQGRLGYFNLGYWFYFNDNEAARTTWQSGTLARLRAVYDKAKEFGLLDRAYIYGCDEVATNFFARVEEAAALIKAACPGVPIMTTTYDQSYGMDSGINSVDIFCPLTPKFDLEQVARARAANKEVWWYICCAPHHPYANMFIEYPAIEGRLLMGAMTAKLRPDGFLYYQISIWNSQKPITDGPFTDWSARSWTTYHGDGAWSCVGPDGTPLPTQRLENFRDGLEDFAYVRILEERMRGQESDPAAAAWLAEARAALAVPETLVANMKEYARDPAALYAWRDRLAELIERAPAPLLPLLKP
ncbi:MAG: DUF6067 family protein [Kiritimatiellae bacterium]|nr:DUF6067 family protein [Kiritimatiellia bacterium]